MAKRRRGNRLVELAEANTDLRYGPEESSLQALLGQADEDYKIDRRVASGTAATAIRGARKARPLLRKIYNQAAIGVKAAQDDVEAAFNQAGVTPDNAFKLVAESEGTAYRQKMAAEAANARRETVKQVQQARVGKVFALGAARDRYNQTRSQLDARAQDLSGERQSFLISELGRMRAERADRRAETRNARAGRQNAKEIALIQQNRDPKTGKPLPGTGANAFDPASRSDRRLFQTKLARAVDNAPDLIKAGYSRKEVAAMLRAGLSDTAAGGPGLGFKAVDDELAVRAALDMAMRGSLSAQTRAEMLDERGIRPKSIQGLNYIANKRKRRRVAGRRARQRAVGIQNPLGIGQGKRPGAGSIPVIGDILGLG